MLAFPRVYVIVFVHGVLVLRCLVMFYGAVAFDYLFQTVSALTLVNFTLKAKNETQTTRNAWGCPQPCLHAAAIRAIQQGLGVSNLTSGHMAPDLNTTLPCFGARTEQLLSTEHGRKRYVDPKIRS